MGVRTISVSTPEVMAFVDACRDQSYEPSQALVLLNRALASHVACCRRARNVLPVELVLRMFWDMQSPARRRYSHTMLRAARRLAPDHRRGEKPAREILISQPHAQAGVSLVGRPGAQMTKGRRLGLHYQFAADATTVTIVPLVGIDTEKLVDGLQTAMAEIVRIAGAR